MNASHIRISFLLACALSVLLTVTGCFPRRISFRENLAPLTSAGYSLKDSGFSKTRPVAPEESSLFAKSIFPKNGSYWEVAGLEVRFSFEDPQLKSFFPPNR